MISDQIGSTRILLNGNGEVDWFSDYEPFGQNISEISMNNQAKTDQCFSSYTRDMEIGLQYAMNRYMDSELGRFISEDPAKDGTNWYSYAKNNPLRWIDPTGLYTINDDDESVTSDDEDFLVNSSKQAVENATGQSLDDIMQKSLELEWLKENKKDQQNSK